MTIERKFHYTTYPFGYTDKAQYVKIADVRVGDWVLLESKERSDHYYRVVHIDNTFPDQSTFYFHGHIPLSFRSGEDLLLVRDPTVPDNVNDPIQEMQKALVEIEEYVGILRRNGKLDAVTNLLDTKANLLIAITEARRS